MDERLGALFNGCTCVRSLLIAIFILSILLASQVHAGMNPDGKVAVHVLSHENRTCVKAFPVISYCGEIVTTYEGCGEIDFFPVFFGLTGYRSVHYGMLWPGSGSCFFTSCSDLVIGQIEWSGDGIAQAWSDCHMASAVIPGWGWITTEEPGLICVDVHPGNNTLEVIDCEFQEDYPSMSFCAGVCGEAGMDPCEGLSSYAALDVDIESSIGSGCIFVGDDMTYTISYGNSVNPGMVSGVLLTCGYSPHTLLLYASGDGQAIYGDRVGWNLGTLPAGGTGSVYFTVRVKPETLLGTVLPVTAVIGCNEAPDSTVADSTMVCVEEPPPYVALDVDIESSIGSGCIFVGDDMTYTISYGNSVNPRMVSGVVLTCGYSPHTLLLYASGNGQAIYGDRVGWDLGTLPVGGTGSVYFTVRVKPETLLGAVLPVTAVIGCNEAPDSTVADSTMVCVEEPPPYVALDVDIESSIGSGCIFVGDDMTYSISYGNPVNPGTVNGVVLTCRYSPRTLLLHASGNGQAVYGGRVRWNIGTLLAGGTGSVQFSVRVKQETHPGAVLPVTAVIGCNEAPDSTVADSTMVCVEDLAPLGLSKDDNVGEDEKVPIGDYIVYAIAFDNAGNSADVNNVRIVDYLSPLSHFVSASGGGVYDSGSRSVTWETGTLPGGGRDSVELTTRVGYGAGEWDTIVNSCSVKGDETRTTRINERTEVRLAKVAIHVRPHAYWHKCTGDTPHIHRCWDIWEDSDSCDVTVYPVFFDFPEFQALEYSIVWPDDWGSMSFISCSDATIGSIVHPWDSVVQSWDACRGGGLVIPAVCHVTGTGPGQIRVAENWDSGRIGITTCRGNTYNVTVSFPGGVCGENVDAPCGGPTRTVPTTWGKIKSMFK